MTAPVTPEVLVGLEAALARYEEERVQTDRSWSTAPVIALIDRLLKHAPVLIAAARERDTLAAENARLREAAKALADALPLCQGEKGTCWRTATKSSQVEMSGPRKLICDEHRGDWNQRGDDLSYGPALRVLLAILVGP